MNGSDEKRSEERGISWVPTTGSVIGGIAKERRSGSRRRWPTYSSGSTG